MALFYFSTEKEEIDHFEDQVEDVDDEDAEADESDRIGGTAFRPVPDDLQQGVAVGVAQEHEVLVIAGIDQVDDACQ